MNYLCAAYNAAPVTQPWNGTVEAAYYRALKGLPRIGLLELPMHATGEIHAQAQDWLLEQLHPGWDFVLTLIPGTLQCVQKSPAFGLASTDEAGRVAALRLADQAREAVRRINVHLGRKAVRWVEVHSAPRQGVPGIAGSVEALAASLRELQRWDWDGAGLAIEHCDRYVAGQRPEKGFLALEQEIEAIQQAGRALPLGIVINWGRSAIEARDPETPLRHIRAARAAGLLRGVTFSGCTDHDPHYGEWLDQHAPFAPFPGAAGGCANSLLTVERAAACLREAGADSLSFVGFKVQPLPATLAVEQRVALLAETITALERARAA
jgi:hypothetical protein